MSCNFQFHQKVSTPNGPGLVQGRFIRVATNGHEETEKILVSHNEKDCPALFTMPGIWQLKSYFPDQLQPLEATRG